MATSPNYGWLEPDNTDLVKNGALAIRTLGNAIDTTMATMVPKSIVDAKGDLIAGTAADTTARLAVGNNGETLVADSSTATGLRYQSSITGGKNFAINGGMDIWQRGTSFTSTGTGYSAYTADRWTCYAQGTGTITQDTSLSASGFRYGIKFTSSAASSGNDFYQLVETDQTVPLAGKQVAVSGYCIATSGVLPLMNLEYSTTVNDGLFGTYVQCTKTTISEPTATGSLLRYTYSFAVPTTAKTLRLRASTGSLNNTNYAIWTGIQLEVGSVPTAFSRAGGTIQGELAACQRYYNRIVPNGVANATIGFGLASSTTNLLLNIALPVPMRVNPTALDSSGVDIRTGAGGSAGTFSNIYIETSQCGNQQLAITATVTSGLTANTGYYVRTTSSAGYVGFSAEL